MAQDEREILELLKFELKFLEDGGYGRSPRTPWLSELRRPRSAASVQRVSIDEVRSR